MAYIEAEGVLANANMKKGGKPLIQIEVAEDLENREDYFHLRKMIEKNVRSARTNKSMDNEQSEVKPEAAMSEGEDANEEVVEFTENGDQQPGNSEGAVLGKDEIENIILSGQGSTFEDLSYDFKELLTRKCKGETRMEIAQMFKVSSSKLSADWSEYKKRVKAFLDGEENGAA